MSVVSHGFAGGGGQSGYQVQRSLRLRAAASADFYRSVWSGANRKTFTLSIWPKRGLLDAAIRTIAGSYDGVSAAACRLYFDTSHRLAFDLGGAAVNTTTTSAVFRDPTNFNHIVFNYDSTQATAADRLRMYADNVLLSFSASSYPTLNQDCQWFIDGRQTIFGQRGAAGYYDGLFAKIDLVQGQRLTPSSFGETISGVWVPKRYVSGHGTRGFELLFDDPTNTTTLLQDTSGGGNHFTGTNISVTAGATNDSLTDSPTNNHCTLNSAIVGATGISNANLTSTGTNEWGTFNVLAANCYWEMEASGTSPTGGVISEAFGANTVSLTSGKTYGFRTTTAGALDYRNITDGGSWTSITTGLTGVRYPFQGAGTINWNFGQRPFAGAVPSGYAAPNSANISDQAITMSGTFTGNASADGPLVYLGGNPLTMTINGNAVTWGTHADKLATGFKLRTSSASYNTAGSNTYTVTLAGTSFYRPNRAQVNP